MTFIIARGSTASYTIAMCDNNEVSLNSLIVWNNTLSRDLSKIFQSLRYLQYRKKTNAYPSEIQNSTHLE